MFKILDQLTATYKQLETASLEIQRQLENMPPGYLGTKKKKRGRKNYTEYYWYNHPFATPQREKYIRRTELDQAKKLAKKHYYTNLLKVISKQMDVIAFCMSELNPDALIDCYDQMSHEKSCLIKPMFSSAEAYAQEWQAQEYPKYEEYKSSMEYKSPKGEMLRSKSELLLAKLFCEYDIPYHYEYPLPCNNGVVYRPDFFLLNKRTREEYYWEHLGGMDSESYRSKSLKKLEIYAENGIILGKNLILTFETSTATYDEAYMRTLIKEYLL